GGSDSKSRFWQRRAKTVSGGSDSKSRFWQRRAKTVSGGSDSKSRFWQRRAKTQPFIFFFPNTIATISGRSAASGDSKAELPIQKASEYRVFSWILSLESGTTIAPVQQSQKPITALTALSNLMTKPNQVDQTGPKISESWMMDNLKSSNYESTYFTSKCCHKMILKLTFFQHLCCQLFFVLILCFNISSI
ncbi:hypothetical protein BOX15_Mlig006255g24, partial [Macrostomum lignano]